MKKIKKLTSLLLAMAMAFGLSTAAWAGTITNDGTFINNGTITGGTLINNGTMTGSGTINGRPMDSSSYNVSFRVEQNWLFIDLTVPTSEAGKNHIVQMYDENDNQIIGQAFGTTPMQSLTPNNAGMYVKWAVFEGGVEVNPDTATPVAKGEFANKLVVATSPSVPTMGTVSVTRTALSDGGYAYKVTGLDTTSGGTTIRNGWLRCPNSTGGSAYLRLTDGQVMSDGSFTTCYPCVEQITQNTDGSYAVTWYESSEPVTVEAETSVETAYLLDYGASTGLARTWLGLLLYLDGTEVEAELSNSKAELAGLKGRPVYMSGDSTYSVITNTGSGLAGSSYNKANGTLTLTAVESSAYGEANTANLGDAIATTGAVNINMPNSSASVRGNANTIFLMRETDTDTVDVYTGIRNVPNVKSRDNTVVSAMLDSNGYATSVLIVDGDLSNTTTTDDIDPNNLTALELELVSSGTYPVDRGIGRYAFSLTNGPSAYPTYVGNTYASRGSSTSNSVTTYRLNAYGNFYRSFSDSSSSGEIDATDYRSVRVEITPFTGESFSESSVPELSIANYYAGDNYQNRVDLTDAAITYSNGKYVITCSNPAYGSTSGERYQIYFTLVSGDTRQQVYMYLEPPTGYSSSDGTYQSTAVWSEALSFITSGVEYVSYTGSDATLTSNLTINAGQTLDLSNAKLTIGNGATLTLASTSATSAQLSPHNGLSIANGGTLAASGSGYGYLSSYNNGNIDVNAGGKISISSGAQLNISCRGYFINQGEIIIGSGGTSYAELYLYPNSGVTANSAKTSFTGLSFYNYGTVQIASGAELSGSNSSLYNDSAATITGSGSLRLYSGPYYDDYNDGTTYVSRTGNVDTPTDYGHSEFTGDPDTSATVYELNGKIYNNGSIASTVTQSIN